MSNRWYHIRYIGMHALLTVTLYAEDIQVHFTNTFNNELTTCLKHKMYVIVVMLHLQRQEK